MPFSYSQYAKHKRCGLQYKFSYIDKLPEPSSAAMSRGSMLHDAMEALALGKSDLLPTAINQFQQWLLELREGGGLEPEKRVAFDADWNPTDWDTCEYRMIFDLYVAPKGPTLNIYEYKTGKMYPEHTQQRMFYGLGGLLCTPEATEVNVTGVYLDKNIRERSYFHRDMLEAMKANWRQRFENVANPETWIPNPGYHCRWCAFSKANGGPCQF